MVFKMNEIFMALRFGRFLGKGDDALLLLKEIVPFLKNREEITFDFLLVRNMNDSFSNALFTNIVRKFGATVLNNITFRHCNKRVKAAIDSSLNLK